MSDDAMELMRGTLDVLILRTLAWGPMHGYAVSRWIRDRTEGTLTIEDAPLYKALHRLEGSGCIEAEWGVSENNRRARYYQLTRKGRAQLDTEVDEFVRFARAVFRALDVAPTPV